MAMEPWTIEPPTPALKFYNDLFELRTDKPLQFIDLTELVAERVRRSGIVNGLVNVQTRHTTTAIVVNENEPGLLEDVTDLLARLAPRDASYRHDDLEHRHVPPEERPNAHSHLRSVVLAPSATLNLVEGKIQLGPWQRIFLVELDGARKRAISIGVMGMTGPSTPRGAAVARASYGRAPAIR